MGSLDCHLHVSNFNSLRLHHKHAWALLSASAALCFSLAAEVSALEHLHII